MKLSEKILADGHFTLRYYNDFFTRTDQEDVVTKIKQELAERKAELVGAQNYHENPPAATMTYDCYDVYYKEMT